MKKTIIFILVSLIPIGIIGGGLYWAVNKNATFEKYKHTKGEIIKINEDKLFDYPFRKRNFYYPTIRYYDDNGENYTFELKKGPELYPGEIGEEVNLLFNPRHPEDAIVDSFLSKWFGPLMVCTVGLFVLIIVLIVSAVVLLKEKKQDKK
jgi:uncharacterized protein YxeA